MIQYQGPHRAVVVHIPGHPDVRWDGHPIDVGDEIASVLIATGEWAETKPDTNIGGDFADLTTNIPPKEG
jgi:hypothetical protein